MSLKIVKKQIVSTLFIAILLLALTSLIPRYTYDGFVQRGWPFSYSKTIDTKGLCLGYSDEISNDNCSQRSFPYNYFSLILDVAFWSSVCTVSIFGYEKIKIKGNNNK